MVGSLGAWGWGVVSGDWVEGSGWLVAGGSEARAWLIGGLGPGLLVGWLVCRLLGCLLAWLAVAGWLRLAGWDWDWG